MDIYKGAVIVTEVKTGKILAMVSHPDFNPNEIADIWDNLIEDDTSSVLLNRATQGLYPPGSTFKIITALEYIRENPAVFENYSYTCNGYFKLGGNKIRCYHGVNHGVVSFEESFAKSCNSSFVNIGMELEQDRFQDTLDALMFGKDLPLTLNHNQSNVVLSPEMSEDDMMQASIGQGRSQITPIHLNMITCAIANGGILMSPYTVDRVENNVGDVVKLFKPSEFGRLMTAEESEILRRLMVSVVENGTAKKLKGRDYSAAGKTGSA